MKHIFTHKNSAEESGLFSLSKKASFLIRGTRGDNLESWRPVHEEE